MNGKPDAGDDDATVKLPRRRQFGRPLDRPLIPAGGGVPPIFRLIALVLVVLVGIAGWFAMRERAADTYTGTIGTGTPLPSIAVHLADEAEILANSPEQTTVFRFVPNPRILIIDFSSLRDQGLMLNRAAAMVEKMGLPRDRVLRDEELDAAISAAGDTIETYYFGHDYAAADLVRFFAVADRDKIALNPQEEWLRKLLRQEGLLEPGARGALITIPRVGSGDGIDAGLRATILRHELSHAEFFTNPVYADYARGFWRDGLDEAARNAFRRYLAALSYDTALEDLMVNEMQAYLMHTNDTRLFSAGGLGVPIEVMDRWQAGFLLGMPNGWLRDACVAALPSAGTILRRPRRQRPTRQRPVDSTRKARVLTRNPRRSPSAIAA